MPQYHNYSNCKIFVYGTLIPTVAEEEYNYRSAAHDKHNPGLSKIIRNVLVDKEFTQLLCAGDRVE